MPFTILAVLMLATVVISHPESITHHKLARRRFELQNKKGDMTYYNESGKTGACELPTNSSHFVAALNMPDFGKFARGKNSPKCGICIQAYSPSSRAAPVVLKITDMCPGCKMGDIDVSRNVFEHFHHPDKGRVDVEWSLVACPQKLGPVSNLKQPPPLETGFNSPVKTQQPSPVPRSNNPASVQQPPPGSNPPANPQQLPPAPGSNPSDQQPPAPTSDSNTQVTAEPSPTANPSATTTNPPSMNATATSSSQINYSQDVGNPALNRGLQDSGASYSSDSRHSLPYSLVWIPVYFVL